jgi:16S rRNA processing protein RimM
MIRADEVYPIGHFRKPHGVNGELQFAFTDDVFDRTDADYLICCMDGIFVPFYIKSYRFRSDTSALMKLEGVNSVEAARRFTNAEVYFPRRLAEPSPDDEPSDDAPTPFDRFIGYTLRGMDGKTIGEITDVDDTTTNILFVIDRDGSELLIPACEDWMRDDDARHQLLQMDIPEGLLDLDAAPSDRE